MFKSQSEWLHPLKKLFTGVGSSPENWDIYRGDNFQVEITKPENALLFAIRIKTLIKSISSTDVRMAIGIGTKDFHSNSITESNGEAFIHSGLTYEKLKKDKQNLAIKTPWDDFDQHMNLCLRLGLIVMDNWSTVLAQYIQTCIDNRGKSQQEIAQILNISQPSASDREKRAYWSEISAMERWYRERIMQRIGS